MATSKGKLLNALLKAIGEPRPEIDDDYSIIGSGDDAKREWTRRKTELSHGDRMMQQAVQMASGYWRRMPGETDENNRPKEEYVKPDKEILKLLLAYIEGQPPQAVSITNDGPDLTYQTTFERSRAILNEEALRLIKQGPKPA